MPASWEGTVADGRGLLSRCLLLSEAIYQSSKGLTVPNRLAWHKHKSSPLCVRSPPLNHPIRNLHQTSYLRAPSLIPTISVLSLSPSYPEDPIRRSCFHGRLLPAGV
ncbi:unnamed protein product [Pleuronectes platessa]|uniref:Uncharacterized protein n=1 Tax=Pleuronectes platessa TaxID=8262 RepID=A0A9N7UA40_PLEPL|nr:unnamed protein product [Pleuronectes platessa]